MTSIIISIVGLVVMVLGNIGGWVWFISRLNARVSNIETEQERQNTVILQLPQSFVPRLEVEARDAAKRDLEKNRDERLNRIETKLDKLLERPTT